MSLHTNPHPLAGQTVRIKDGARRIGGAEILIKDWWDRVHGSSWMHADGNPACLAYSIRAGVSRLPTDDEVVYGHIGVLGHLVHVSELEVSR